MSKVKLTNFFILNIIAQLCMLVQSILFVSYLLICVEFQKIFQLMIAD